MLCKYQCTHSFDGENEVELQITYEYTPPTPARGPSYSCAGEPPGYSEVDVLGILVDGRTATANEFDAVCENVRLFEEMEMHGADCIADERAAAAEYRAAMRKE